MKTDHALGELFAEDPDLIKLFLAGAPECHYTMKSEVVKEVERRVDACFFPDDPCQPIQVTEFLGYQDANAIYRLVSGGCLIGMRNPGRVVHYLLILLDGSLDPKTEPWHSYSRSGLPGFRVVTMETVLRNLSKSQEDHPLVAFLPVLVESDLEKVKASIPAGFRQIQDAGLPEYLFETYVKIYLYWLTQRLSTLSRREVIEMLQIQTPFEETRFYRDLKEEIDAEARDRIKALERERDSAQESIITRQLELLDQLRKEQVISEATYRQRAAPLEAELETLRAQRNK